MKCPKARHVDRIADLGAAWSRQYCRRCGVLNDMGYRGPVCMHVAFAFGDADSASRAGSSGLRSTGGSRR
jgi:hypothetical protein